MKDKSIQKMISTFIIVSFLFSNISVTLAKEVNTAKEEVVYGILNQDGSVNQAYIVNIFDQAGKVTDYGDYCNVRNMTSEDKLSLKEGKVEFSKGKEKLYYEGELINQELPWNISLKYFIDGQEYSAKEIAGLSGDLEIKLSISENKQIDPFFYNNYGLQATLLLDTEKVSDIQAEQATIANVGKNKQLTYTILPKKGADLSIKAKVKDFEMPAVEINGININLGFDVDNDQLLDKIEELQTGVKDINEGAGDLNNGAGQLKDGSDQLADGSKRLENGAVKISGGLNSLQSGIEQLNNGLWELNNHSEALIQGSNQFKTLINKSSEQLLTLSEKAEEMDRLLQASKEIQSGINQLNNSLGELNQSISYEAYQAVLSQNGLALNQIQAGNTNGINALESLTNSLANLSAQIRASDLENREELAGQVDQLANQTLNSGLDKVFMGNNAVIEATATYLNQLSDASSQVQAGSQDLNDSYDQFHSAIEEMLSASEELTAQLPDLTENIDQLVDQYNQFDQGIKEYTQAVGQLAAGQQEVLNGARKLSQGVMDLQLGSATLNENMQKFNKATKDLYDGTQKLKDGSDEFKNETENLDQTIEQEIDDTISEMTGDASQPLSFASSRNGKIKSVQFVLKTSAIEIEEDDKEETIQEEPQPSAWDKVKGLFKGEED
ncbi:hypothetical protein [Facklamia sp. 7083-14-GEN3]|uniref:hypothetical protein n=1 Tax=Facklamia sp. 7083-14-GEN3 TaxID=2973478 RepID=UPI00215D233C|nr:hypothetical protein [Facklamia sp. 7083-14-GEN3]MCR8969798.1 hypothetical protein [Facklamia sp. 7083-14-GEN3]